MHLLSKVHTKCFELGNRLHVFVSTMILYIFKLTQTSTCVRRICLVVQVCPCVDSDCLCSNG